MARFKRGSTGFDRIIAGPTLPDDVFVPLHQIRAKFERCPAASDRVEKHHRVRLNFPHGVVQRFECIIYWLTQKRAASVAFALQAREEITFLRNSSDREVVRVELGRLIRGLVFVAGPGAGLRSHI